MKKIRKNLVIIVLVSLVIPLMFIPYPNAPASSGGQQGGGDSWELNRAIAELSDPDQYVRRNAAREIGRLTRVPGVQRSVLPLINAIKGQQNITEGNFNLSIFLQTLGAVVRELFPHIYDFVSNPEVYSSESSHS